MKIGVVIRALLIVGSMCLSMPSRAAVDLIGETVEVQFLVPDFISGGSPSCFCEPTIIPGYSLSQSIVVTEGGSKISIPNWFDVTFFGAKIVMDNFQQNGFAAGYYKFGFVLPVFEMSDPRSTLNINIDPEQTKPFIYFPLLFDRPKNTTLIDGYIATTKSSTLVFTIDDAYHPPVPEPATFAMMLAGLCALGLLCRRQTGVP